MKNLRYKVISNNYPISAGEIRVEADSLEAVMICRYSKNLDFNSKEVLGMLNMVNYVMLDKYHFLQDVRHCLVRAHMKTQQINITEYVMGFFELHENY